MKNVSVCLAILMSGVSVQAFTNLNFESANVTGYTPGSDIPVTNAFPGWNAYEGNSDIGTNSLSQVWYDNLSLGSAAVTLIDTNNEFGFMPLQGRFSAYLNGFIPLPDPPPVVAHFAAIGQTGQIPMDAQSLVFWATSIFSFDVTFADLPISLVTIGFGPDYEIVAGDISGFAGQTGELRFTAPPQRGGFLDNIQFSTSPIPEPSGFVLIGLSGLIFSLHRRRNRSM